MAKPHKLAKITQSENFCSCLHILDSNWLSEPEVRAKVCAFCKETAKWRFFFKLQGMGAIAPGCLHLRRDIHNLYVGYWPVGTVLASPPRPTLSTPQVAYWRHVDFHTVRHIACFPAHLLLRSRDKAAGLVADSKFAPSFLVSPHAASPRWRLARKVALSPCYQCYDFTYKAAGNDRHKRY